MVSKCGRLELPGTVSPLHTNLQVGNFQRCKPASLYVQGPEPVPSTSGMSEIAARPPSPIADDPSALPSPTSSPSSSQELFLPVHSMPAPVCQLLCCTTVLFKVKYCTVRLKMFSLFSVFVFYVLFV